MSPKNAVIYRKGAKGAKGRKEEQTGISIAVLKLFVFLCDLRVFAPLR
jgi:hypothetical protein